MDQSSKRWIEVTPSEFVHERDGLEHLARAVPDRAPYYVFSNFTFQGDNGRRLEVDALVISPAQINLIELKSWSGHFTGNEHNWRSDWNGGSSHRNPLNAANYKSKLLASRLGTILSRVLREHPEYPSDYGDAPWVQESVFLHSENIRTDFTAQGMQNVFGIDGRTNRTNLPGIGDRITEKPRRFRSPVDQGFAERVLVPAIKEITGYRTRRAHAGPWLLTRHVDDEEDRQVWEAVNRRDAAAKTGKKDRAIVRVADIPRGADRVTANRLYSLARREYELLKELSHPGIEAPFALEIADTPGAGESPALIYRPSDGFEPLDLLYPGLVLTAAQQVEVVSQVADAVTYAHANNAVHRRLTPSAVLLNTRLLDKEDPGRSEIQVKVSRWTAVTENVQSTRMRSAQTAGMSRFGATSSSVSTAFDESAGFLPPEGFDGSADRTLGDLFSVGALAFFVFSGGRQPATSRAGLTRELSRSGGLDLDATGAQVESRLRDLVLGVTAPSPAERLKAVKGSSHSGQKENPVKLFLGRLQGSTRDRQVQEGDALHPKVGEMLADRFEMLKQLGTGSTALGLLVNDTTVETDRVLKVARDESKIAELELEAESLTELAAKLEGSPYRKHFVELLEPTLRLPFDRTALLLSFGGEFTLADQLQMGPLGAEQFWTHGEQLLTLLVALEDTGLTHRDIKPANLGLRGKPSAKTLVLFDFSLSHRSLTETDLGTRPYLDPFLSRDAVPARPHFDGYAERYSAVVVLLQMATADYPRYGDDDGTAVELTDGRLALTPEDLPEVWPLAQREALTELFRANLDRDVRRRAGSAQDLLELFRSIKGAASRARPPSSRDSPDTSTGDTATSAATVSPTPASPAGPGLQSLKDLCEELITYSGDKNTHERRLVSNILGVADKSPADPFEPPSVYATILDASPGKMPRLTAAIEPLWQATPALHRSMELLQGKLAATLRSMGGIASPEDLRSVVEELFPTDAPAVPTPGQTPAQNGRRQLGVLRLLEMALSRRADGDGRIHLVRRQAGDATSTAAQAIALTDDPALTGLPAVLAEAARAVLSEAPHELVDARTLTDTLSAAAVDYLGVTPAELQVAPSILPRLAADADAGLAVTATGDLYPVDMSTAALVRAVFPTASMKVPRSVLSNKVRRRFPEAVNSQLPAHPVLTDIVSTLVPDMQYDATRKEFFRPQETSGSDDLVTRHTNTYGRTVGLSDRPRAELPEADRRLLHSLESTCRQRSFRVVQVETGKVSTTVGLLERHLDARHVDVGAIVLDELWHLFEETNQTDKFGVFLEADAPDHPLHAQLGQLIRLSAKKALANALNQADGGYPVVLSHPSILASFDCLDLLSTWSQIGAQNASPVWLVTTDDAPSPTNAHAVDGVQLPLSSPDQVLSY
ncbi:NERD domain-containing protein [Corynebacterium glyciniphilum]|uniref:NERD domain-containing protein n=1 Tax=Corynebacterium glyciniphilum TaxID=1404244 RepID=UPI00264D1B28|nr:NERD domain-containing protein [Corynebacterium glyciniphilum]MDN6706340.1 NERD domain-containing protein [Corynebacterium glyciniphilum]